MTPSFVSTTRINMADSPGNIDESLGDRLRDRRTSCGLSQEQLAHKLQIGPKDISAYERGFVRISADRLLQIARALGVRPDYFFRFPNQRQVDAVENDQERGEDSALCPSVLDEGAHLQRAFVSIKNPTVRKSIVAFVVELAKGENTH